MTDRLLCEILHADRQMISALGALRLSINFALPQTWTMQQLLQRWPTLNAEAIAQLARDRVGYQGEAKGLTLLLDEVIAIDAVIADRMRAMRSTRRIA